MLNCNTFICANISVELQHLHSYKYKYGTQKKKGGVCGVGKVGAHWEEVGGGDRTRKVKGVSVENTMQGGDPKNRAAPGGGGCAGGGSRARVCARGLGLGVRDRSLGLRGQGLGSLQLGEQTVGCGVGHIGSLGGDRAKGI